MKKILTLTAALAAAATLAACSSGGGASHASSGPPPNSSGAASAPATQINCAELAGTPVPKTLAAVDCGGATVASMSYGCYPGGHYHGSFFWISPEAADGRDLMPYVGRPGGTWMRGKASASVHQMAALVGC
jgi:hypothetical protein